MKRIRLVSHGKDYPGSYSFYIDQELKGYIILTIWGYEAHFDSGLVLNATTFSCLLRMVVSYG